jgi:hypothetical protein
MGQWKCIISAGALGMAMTVMSPTAEAFFPPVPQPGEVITVVPPVTPPPIVVPPVTPPVPPVCRPAEQPHCGCDTPENPQTVPEPATVIMAVSGAALAAAWKRRRSC